MKKIKVAQYEYKNEFGSITLKNLQVFLDPEDVKKYNSGVDLEKLDYGLSAETIRNAEEKLAIEFFKEKYGPVVDRVYQLNINELEAIQRRLDLNNVEFAKVLGVNKGSYSNILKRGKLLHSTALFAMDKLGRELLEPGAAKRSIGESVPFKAVSERVKKEIKDTFCRLTKQRTKKKKILNNLVTPRH